MALREFGFAEGDLTTEVKEDDGLIWKPILREGTFKLTPTSKGVVDKPFHVVKGKGKSNAKNFTVSIDDLVESFDQNAFEHVTIPTSHKDELHENTGFIRQLKTDQDEKGRTVVLAGMDFTEEDIKGKVERGTIPNCSSGIFFDHVRKADKKSFPVALKHASLTDTPWVTELKPFGKSIMAADDEIEDGEEIEFLQFSDDTTDNDLSDLQAADSSEVVWEDTEGFRARQDAISNQLRNLTQGIKVQTGDEIEFYVKDVSPDKALVENFTTSTKWVVPYSLEDGDAKLADYSSWVEAETIMVAAEDEENKEVSDEKPEETTDNDSNSSENEENGPENADSEPNSEENSEKTTENLNSDQESVKLSESSNLTGIHLELHLAQEDRARRANDTDSGGNKMGIPADIDLSSVELSDEVRSRIELAFDKSEKADEYEKTIRENEIDSKVDSLKELGLDQNPGLLKFARRIYLSDDNQPAAILLADEENKKEESITLSDALDQFIELLPKNQEGKLQLSDQANAEEEGDAPENGDEDKTSVAVTAAVEALDEEDQALLASDSKE